MEKVNLPGQFMDLAIPRQPMQLECQQWCFGKTPQEDDMDPAYNTNNNNKNADQVEHRYFIRTGIRTTQQNGLPRF